MSKNVAMFVDVANMYYAARGQDVDVDYVALLKHATKGRDLIRAYAYTGLDPENENQRKFIDFLAKNGYKPVVKDIRKFGDGRMKANLDIELVVDLFRLADRMDIAVIVSGDGDFAPAIRALQDKGVRCEVISFKPNTSSDLVAVADEFMDIMKVASISRKEARATTRDRGMSAPEMPAKEVTPEFGFREASPSVAAAALAALKSGGTASVAGNGRRTRGAGTRRGAAPSEEPPGERAISEPAIADAATVDPTAETEEGRRRRRRRGGRGRGRGRRDEAATPVESGGSELMGSEEIGSEAIGWEELDDLSQVDGFEADREFGFEEADAATLAELGIDPADLGAADAEPERGKPAGEEKPKRRTRAAAKASGSDETDKPKRTRRSTKAAADSAGDAGSDEGDKPKRSGRGAKPSGDARGSDEGDKPKRTRRSPQRAGSEPTEPTAPSENGSSSAAAADGSDEPQGIWGRFRSARKPRTAGG